MNRREIIKAAGLAAAFAAGAGPAAAEAAAGDAAVPLDAMLRPYLEKYKLPAIAAAAVVGGKTVAAGAVGTRRSGTTIPVTLDDRFHFGSDTKAMTALLAAMLIEQGKLRWDSTVADVFPELTGKMAPRVGGVRIDQLLSHTSGIPSDNDAQDKLLLDSYDQTHLNLDEMRYWIVERLIAMPLESEPGERFAYANMGYVLAGAITERLYRSTWEELVATRIFDPLGLKTAGFGPPATLGRIDAPLGHRLFPDGTVKAMLAGPNGDNPEMLGPAGTVHMSILEFATWAGWNAGQGRRAPALVTPETLRKLHTPVVDIPVRPDAQPGTPPPGKYGLGWGTVSVPFAPEPLIFHGGSNQMNLAYIMLQPDADFAMVMATNISGESPDDALRAVAEELYRRFAKSP
jgi:CubicO group peptidase (beta-lactamase class C family)